MTTTKRAGSGVGAGAAALAVLAALAAGAAAAFAGATALCQPDRARDAGPDGPRVAELMLAARAADRFGATYPTPAPGWHPPAPGSPGAAPILSRPPGLDLATRMAFGVGGTARATARALAAAFAAAAVLAMARLCWIGWGAWAAPAGAALLALTPYAARWGAFPDGGMPALAAVLMALGSVLQFRRTRTRLPAVMATVWMLAAGAFDWSAYLVVVPLAALAFGGGAVGGKIGRSRPQALGLPDGLAGPLANIIRRREGRAAVALTAVLAAAASAELLFFLAWFFELDALGAFFATLDGAVPGPLLTLGAPAGGLATEMVGAPGKFVAAVWAATAIARALRGQAEARSVPVAALLGAGILFPLLFARLAANSFHLPALAVGGVVLAAIDLAATMGALLVGRRLTLPEPPRAAVAVSLAGAAALALLCVPAWRRGSAEPVGPDALAEARAVARALADITEASDRVLLPPGFAADPRFLLELDRDVERAGAASGGEGALDGAGWLAGLAARAAREPHVVALLPDPPPASEAAAFAELARAHPVDRVGATWIVDPRRPDAGVRTFAVNGRALVPHPADDLRLNLTLGVTPAGGRLPELEGDGDLGSLTRAELIAFHNMLPAGPARARAAARVVAGASAAEARWFDPAPLGLPAGVRWDADLRRIDVLWSCPGTRAPLPPGVNVGGARVVLKPADRDWAPAAVDRAAPATCAPGAPAGELHEQSFAVKLPFKGRFHVAIQLMRDGKPRRPLNPAPVELGIVDGR